MIEEFVMPGFMPGIHVFDASKDVDGRDRPGHDESVPSRNHRTANGAL
jgi:hypothetical protein